MSHDSLPALRLPAIYLSLCMLLLLGCDAGADARLSGGNGSGDALGTGLASPGDPATAIGGSVPQGTGVCASGTSLCEGTVTVSCEGEQEVRTDCAATGRSCFIGVGCATCAAGASSCDGNTPRTCNADGTGWTEAATCDEEAGLFCSAATGGCADLCAVAAASKSYVGCEYWPTTTPNLVNPEFEFAVVIGNPQDHVAHITIDDNNGYMQQDTVDPGAVKTFILPWSNLVGAAVFSGYQVPGSGSAYRLRSSIPVTAYQFSPLEYAISRDCRDSARDSDPFDGRCYAYSNDASLLLPTSVMTGNYMIATRPASGVTTSVTDTQGQPVYMTDPNDPFGFSTVEVTPVSGAIDGGFVTVVGVEDSATEVTVTFTGRAREGSSGTVYMPGQSATFSLTRGEARQFMATPPMAATCTDRVSDVAEFECGSPGSQFFCREQKDYCVPQALHDLTGSRVSAMGKVAVYTGSPCTFVPFDRYACDHLEESVAPMETWGKNFLVAISEALRVGEPNIIRILSGEDGNTLHFEPAVHADVTLNSGEWVELVETRDFQVQSSGALSVNQYLVGQDYAGLQSFYDRALSGQVEVGDPSYTVIPPVEQYRSDYSFLTPSTYEENWVMVTAPEGARVELDGQPLDGWQTVGSSGYSTTRLQVAPGAHTMQGDSTFGIQVYGFGAYTSYMYPGGLDLKEINPII